MLNSPSVGAERKNEAVSVSAPWRRVEEAGEGRCFLDSPGQEALGPL